MKRLAIAVGIALMVASSGCATQAEKYQKDVAKVDAKADDLCKQYEQWVQLGEITATAINRKAEPIGDAVIKAARKACGAIDYFREVDEL